MNGTYTPLIRDLFATVADGTDRAAVTELQQQIHDAKRETEKNLDMAYRWFKKREVDGRDPDPLPPQWNERNDKYMQWLWDYQVLQCSQFLTTALLLEQESRQ